MKTDRALLEAALLGYQAKIAEIEAAIARLREELGHSSGVAQAPVKARRKMSAASRRRIAAAQKKRWAEYKKRQAKR